MARAVPADDDLGMPAGVVVKLDVERADRAVVVVPGVGPVVGDHVVEQQARVQRHARGDAPKAHDVAGPIHLAPGLETVRLTRGFLDAPDRFIGAALGDEERG